MKIGIVPTKYGYSAVALPPYDGDWSLASPVELSDDMQTQLRGQILHELSKYCQMLAPWIGQVLVAIPWALWGAVILYMRLSTYMEYNPSTVLLYGWIMFLFFGDGLWALGRALYQFAHLKQVTKITNWSAKGQWRPNVDLIPERMDAGDMSEREYIDFMATRHPQLIPYYKEIMRREPPLVFTWWPRGLLGFIRMLFIGPRIPKPTLIFELGDLK